MQLKQIPALLLNLARTMAALRRSEMSRIPALRDQYRQRFFGDPLHVCFGCSHTNERGLKMDFYKTDIGGLACQWHPAPGFESFPNIIHGGLSGLILDELGGVVIQSELDVFALTISSQIRYHSPAYSDRNVHAHARIVCKYRRYVLVDAILYDAHGKILTTMTGLYYIPPRKVFSRVTKIQDMSAEVKSYVAE